MEAKAAVRAARDRPAFIAETLKRMLAELEHAGADLTTTRASIRGVDDFGFPVLQFFVAADPEVP